MNFQLILEIKYFEGWCDAYLMCPCSNDTKRWIKNRNFACASVAVEGKSILLFHFVLFDALKSISDGLLPRKTKTQDTNTQKKRGKKA